jgi:predicted Mrr-cat superfamily restriction endonuclease
MSLWLCRAGKHGEHEKRFFDTNRIYLTWEGLEKEDLGKAGDLKQLKSIMRKAYPGVSDTHLGRSAGQVWTFVTDMDPGDWIVVPRKTTPSLAFAEIVGEYEFDEAADGAYQHSRKVRWLNLDVPRSTIDQDLLYSFGDNAEHACRSGSACVLGRGFKSSIAKEVPRQFFKVRMWDQTDLITEIFDHYNELDEDVRAELPLKRIWTIAADEEG